MGIAAIEDMVMKAPGGVDWVVVELTGLADPSKSHISIWVFFAAYCGKSSNS